MSELPSGWGRTTVGDLFNFKYGEPLPERTRRGGEVPVYGSNGVVGSHDEHCAEGPAIVIGRKGSAGVVHYSPIKCWPIDTAYFVDEFHGLPPRYWTYQLRQLDLGATGRASAVPGIGRNDAYVREVRVPPVNEQRRIVDKLDAVFDKTHAAKTRLERLPALLDQLKRSILATAFRGDLTKEWRAANPDVEPASVLLERIRTERRQKWEAGLRAKGKDPKKATYEEPAPVDASELPELPDGWVWASVAQLISEKMCNGISIPGSDTPPGVRSLKLNAFTDEGIDFRAVRFIDIDGETTDDLRLVRGDFLLSRGNGSLRLIGKGVRVAETPAETTVFPDTAIRLRISSELDAAGWFKEIWSSPGVRSQIERRAKTTAGIFKISQTDLAGIVIPLPPLAEATVAAALLAECHVHAQRLRVQLLRGSTAAVHVEQAALAKAFRGELVPQDPNDEPADVLLARLRGAAAATPAPRGRGRPKTTAPASTAPAPVVADGDPLDHVIAALKGAQRLSTSAIADSTGLDAATIRPLLKSLERLGKVVVEGKARGTTYVWQGGSA